MADINRRLHRLVEWGEASQPLGVEIPRLPAWAEETARAATNPEPWAEVVRGIERIAQRRLIGAFEEWDRRTKARLARIDAYSVDSRLEREQIDEAVQAARLGDVAQALLTSQQVDRVVTLKERHLDQARAELERLVAFLKDLRALGLGGPGDPSEVARSLEGQLRAGRLAPLKQEIRALRSQTVERLRATVPRYVSDYGDRILAQRAQGVATEQEATTLARAAREVFQGRPEEGVRLLRQLQQSHGPLPGSPARAPPRG